MLGLLHTKKGKIHDRVSEIRAGARNVELR